MSGNPDQEGELRKRVGDHPADAKGHEQYPGDSEEEAEQRREHDPRVPTPGDPEQQAKDQAKDQDG